MKSSIRATVEEVNGSGGAHEREPDHYKERLKAPNSLRLVTKVVLSMVAGLIM